MTSLGNIMPAELWFGAIQVKSAWFGDKEIWSSEQPTPTKVYAVCFENVGSTTGTIGISKGSSAPSIDLQKSSDGVNWTELNYQVSSYAEVPVGGKVYIRAGLIGQDALANGYNENNINKFSTSISNFKVSGDITALLHQTPTSVLTSNCNFCYLFKQSSIVDAS